MRNDAVGILAVELVLRGAGQVDVGFLLPGLASLEELRPGKLLGIRLADVLAAAAQLEHEVYLLAANAVGVVDVAVGPADGDDLGPQLGSLFGRSPSHVAVLPLMSMSRVCSIWFTK